MKNSFSADPLKSVFRDATNRYFKSNKLSIKGNRSLYLKTVFLLAAYIIPYIVLLSAPAPGAWMFLCCLVMGAAVAGIGMSVMHDACHGSYFSNRKYNNLMGLTMNLLGGNRFNWMVQHNVKHHTYTNIYGQDEDLENGNLIRMSPHADWKPAHRFQHIYSWFLYSLGTLSWVTIKDFKQLRQLSREKGHSYNLKKEWIFLVFTKALYYVFMIVLPLLLLDVAWWWVVAGFVLIHLTAGFILSVTFQLAHVVEGIDHFSDDDKPASGWTEHQLRTTSNFARNSKVLTWFMGGLNYQIEHHLFPHISHVHYPALSRIIRDEAVKAGITYNEHRRFSTAVLSHYNTLKKLGQRPA